MDLRSIFEVAWLNLTARLEAYRRFTCGIFLILGPCCLILAFGFAIRTAFFLHSGDTADGVVVSMATKHDAQGGSDTFSPVFVFQTPDGRQHKVESKVGADPPEFTPGEHVRVVYEAGKPGQAKISSLLQLWFVPLLLAVIAAGLSGVGCLLFFYQRWLGRRRLSLKA